MKQKEARQQHKCVGKYKDIKLSGKGEYTDKEYYNTLMVGHKSLLIQGWNLKDKSI